MRRTAFEMPARQVNIVRAGFNQKHGQHRVHTNIVTQSRLRAGQMATQLFQIQAALGDIILRPGFQILDHACFIPRARDHHHRQLRMVPPHMQQYIHATSILQPHIKQHHIVGLAGQFANRFIHPPCRIPYQMGNLL